MITADHVEQAKPDPDVFLIAALQLGVSLSDCIVVGDSIWDLLVPVEQRHSVSAYAAAAMARRNWCRRGRIAFTMTRRTCWIIFQRLAFRSNEMHVIFDNEFGAQARTGRPTTAISPTPKEGLTRPSRWAAASTTL